MHLSHIHKSERVCELREYCENTANELAHNRAKYLNPDIVRDHAGVISCDSPANS